MWCSSRQFTDLLAQLTESKNKIDALFQTVLDQTSTIARLQGEKSEVERSNAQLLAVNEWMRHQINVLTHERAAMLEKMTGVTVTTPEILSTRGNGMSSGVPSLDDIFSDPEEQHGTKQAADILASRGLSVPVATR